MNSRRPPAPPPELPGFTYEALLGSGGFADVFLYRQQLPERRVAVKVLLADRLAQGSTDAFNAEANMMAQLSTHPSIVTIYQAGVSADGRPYLVMEYCPKPNLQVRYRREPFSVAESLRVGVQVAAAVETAHRAGILHRDIKPANILVTEYNRPALTDFGIAQAGGEDEESAGMSIPWSPPEAFADPPRTGVTTDVWALGATVYTLLAGRSPFELPGERNTSADLIQRIESHALPPLARPDAPASLQAVLERAMAKSPTSRYASAMDFARALQRVQIELSMSPTVLDIAEQGAPDTDDGDEGGELTRVRSVVSIDPTSAPAGAPPTPRFSNPPHPAADETTASRTVMRADRDVGAGLVSAGPAISSGSPHARPSFDTGGTSARADPTVRRGPVAVPPEPEPLASPAPEVEESAAPRRSKGGLIAAVIAGVVVLGGAGAAWAAASGLFGDFDSAPAPTADPGPVDGIAPGKPVPVVTDLVGAVDGEDVVFTWTNPDPEDGDSYLWGVLTPAEETKLARVDDTSVTVAADPSGRTCIEVVLVRADRTSSAQSTQGCAP